MRSAIEPRRRFPPRAQTPLLFILLASLGAACAPLSTPHSVGVAGPTPTAWVTEPPATPAALETQRPTPAATAAQPPTLERVKVSASPDGASTVEVWAGACPPDAGAAATTEMQMRLRHGGGETVLLRQTLSCSGGLGAFGLDVLGWSDDGTYVYTTDAASGGPDGGVCPWWRTAYRHTVATGETVPFSDAVRSPGGASAAFRSGAELAVLEWATGAIAVIPAVDPEGSLASVGWSPDGAHVAFLENSQPLCAREGVGALTIWEPATGDVFRATIDSAPDRPDAAAWLTWETAETLTLERYSGEQDRYVLTATELQRVMPTP